MTRINVLPHADLCPQGAIIEAEPGISICDALLDVGIEIDHACEQSCACTTCHVIVRRGGESLNPPSEQEEDMLDKAWGLEPQSRLSCQARVGQGEITIEIPRYNINLASERH